MSDPFIIGLTGSIGMGKTTTAKMFAEEGIPVWDADAAVHRIYAPGGAAVEKMRDLYPKAVSKDGVDREALKAWLSEDASALKQIEAIVHPLVANDRAEFLATAKSPVVLLDMPLLFEIGASEQVDLVVVVSTNPALQRERVMQRGTMTEMQFEAILAKQVSDAEKRARADVIVPTDTMDGTRRAVKQVVAHVKEHLGHA